jgi:hypothetical protein
LKPRASVRESWSSTLPGFRSAGDTKSRLRHGTQSSFRSGQLRSCCAHLHAPRCMREGAPHPETKQARVNQDRDRVASTMATSCRPSGGRGKQGGVTGSMGAHHGNLPCGAQQGAQATPLVRVRGPLLPHKHRGLQAAGTGALWQPQDRSASYFALASFILLISLFFLSYTGSHIYRRSTTFSVLFC